MIVICVHRHTVGTGKVGAAAVIFLMDSADVIPGDGRGQIRAARHIGGYNSHKAGTFRQGSVPCVMP